MSDPEDLPISQLELCTYRYLQKVAKSMGLPSNVKKVYLIEMIYAKKHRSAQDLESIVNRVKQERKQLAQTKKPRRKKKRVQGMEITSTSDGESPAITDTPRRPSNVVITYPPSSRQTLVKYQQRPNILRPTLNRPIESDRVLRSFNTRMRPNYSILNDNNSVLDVIKAQNALQRSRDLQERQYQLNVAVQTHKPLTVGECVIQRKRPADYGNCVVQMQRQEFDEGERQLVPLVRRSNISPPRPAKRQRQISGIYPLQPVEYPPYQYMPNVGFRQQDGRLNKINAIVQKLHKSRAVPYTTEKRSLLQKNRNVALQDIIPKSSKMVTVQDVMNYRIDRQATNKRSLDFSGNSSTESANSSAYIRNVLTENLHRNNERSDVTGKIRYAENRSHDRENLNKYVDTRNHVSGYMDARNYVTEHLNRNPESGRKTVVNMNIQNVETRNVDIDYPNMSALTDVYPEHNATELNSNRAGNFSVYYHKKIRAEQVRCQRTSIQREPNTITERLPKITDVFSQFSDAEYRNLTQPLYVQVSEESDRLPIHTVNNNMIESIYNFKNQFINSQPLVQIATTANTKCVYSTPIITSAIAHPPPVCNDYNTHSYERDNQYHTESETVPRLYDYLRVAEQERNDNFICDEVLSMSGSSFDTTSSQDMGANVTIPEMVEDALELISQDGDYMERISMDVRMQCILCDWAGPKIILDYHLRKEHSSDISQQDGREWSAVFTLGTLVASEAWCSKLVHYSGNIYVLSTKYLDVDGFMATLSVLPTVNDDIPKYSRLTVYNKVTGEPHAWEGAIPTLSHSMPYHTDVNCLKLDITSLNLLPNSANLKLINRELVINSTAKVVVGQPELNTIDIVVHVQLFD